MSKTAPDGRHKNIVVFCDGTWNREDQKGADHKVCQTNVAKLFEATCPFDAEGNPQVLHYLRGVGTRRRERVTGGGFGLGISDNIKEAYKFICSNYQPGDKIYLFGFSRGAYTARSIAGFIHNLGILKREKFSLLNEAYEHYRDSSDEWHPSSYEDPDNPKKGAASRAFRRENCWVREENGVFVNDTDYKKIRFVGVWDTVGALGAPYGVILAWIINKIFKTGFHDTKLSPSIESASHALAVDERRWPFRPTLWELSDVHKEDKEECEKNFQERWFPGVHSNVGGGYTDSSLSDLALLWMAERAREQGLGIDFDELPQVTLDRSDSEFTRKLSAAPENSQTFYYRWATRVFVKWPAFLWKVIPFRDRDLVQYVQLNGDYIRPIANQDELHLTTTAKIDIDPGYRPPNVNYRP
jgi:uncharacterized protein (DUF2235 family)